MALTLPYPDMNFVPLDVLTAAEQNQLVANIEYIASNIQSVTGVYAQNRTIIYVDGTNGDDSNDGLTNATPKKTLYSAMLKGTEIGGSIDFKFMSAGTYEIGTSVYDGANYIFEKYSTSIEDDVNILVRGSQNIENSYMQFNRVNLLGSPTIALFNSFIQASRITIENPLSFNGSGLSLSESTYRNKMVLRCGSEAILDRITIDPLSSVTSGNIIELQTCSEIMITSFYIQPFPAENTCSLLVLAASTEATLTSAPTDNQGTSKVNRGISTTAAILNATNATLSAYESLGATSSAYTRTLKVVGNATVGA